MRFLLSQEWHNTEKTTKFGGQEHKRYQKGMPHPTPKGQCGTPLPHVPKGRPKSNMSVCAGRFQSDRSWTGTASICTLGTTINGLPEKCSEEMHQTTARATGPSELPVWCNGGGLCKWLQWHIKYMNSYSVCNATPWNQNRVLGQWWWQHDHVSEWIRAPGWNRWIRSPQLCSWIILSSKTSS
jgi:hypothetical protein